MIRQGGLGRGLASLIPPKKQTSAQPVDQQEINYFGSGELKSEASKTIEKHTAVIEPEIQAKPNERTGIGDISLRSVIEVSLGTITANPFQPRKEFHQDKLQELADSIKIHGVIQPLVVTRTGPESYELIAGERRLQAAKLAGLTKVPVIIKSVDDQQKLELALIENIQRHNLNVIEESRSYKRLQDEFSLTQEEIAKRVGKNRSTVANMLRLLSLPIEMQRSLSEGKISEGHARSILSVVNPEKQRALYDLILKEHLTVREVEDKVKEVTVGGHRRRMREPDPNLREREEQLATALGTKVKIKKSPKGGQIAIEYFSPEEFDNLFRKLTAAEE